LALRGGQTMVRFFYALAAVLAFHSVSFATVEEQTCIDKSTTIEEKLGCIKGLTFTADPAHAPRGGKAFEMKFEQPTDHTNPAAGTFQQRLVLIHRGESEPMVLQTSGYNIFTVGEAALTSTFATNQIQVEHRFFAESKPNPLDWSKLDIKQSADDFHAITVAFKQIYSKPWVNTGASKGGMTSVYHRFFYPDDLAGTVADVAPLSFATDDERFIPWIEQIGGQPYAACHDAFKKIQIALLEHRDEVVPTLKGTFSQLGSVDIAFEHSIQEFQFYFFQYGNPDDPNTGCSSIPVNGTIQQMLAFQQSLAKIEDYDDEAIAGFMPYYYQSATQLGGPGNPTAHIKHLLKYPYSIDLYTPKGVKYSYSNEQMYEVDHWVRHEADKLIFVYGEFDPWSGGAFPDSEMGYDVFKFWVPKGNHGSKFNRLAADKKSEVLNILTKWFGKAPAPIMLTGRAESLESLEFQARKLHHLK
jgi:hypothetical protein